jgi:hypothetical protein
MPAWVEAGKWGVGVLPIWVARFRKRASGSPLLGWYLLQVTI